MASSSQEHEEIIMLRRQVSDLEKSKTDNIICLEEAKAKIIELEKDLENKTFDLDSIKSTNLSLEESLNQVCLPTSNT